MNLFHPKFIEFSLISITLLLHLTYDTSFFPNTFSTSFHSQILFLSKSPWTEEPGRLQSMGSQRVRHSGATNITLLQLFQKFFFPKSSFSHSTYFFLWSNDIHVPWYSLPQSILFFIYSAIVSFFIFSSLKRMKSIEIISSIFSFFCCSIVSWLSSET